MSNVKRCLDRTLLAVMALVISKYDGEAKKSDSIDARFVSMKQRRGFYLGSTIMNRYRLPWSTRDRNRKRILLSPLHVSDPGMAMHSSLPHNQLDHDELRRVHDKVYISR